MEFLLSLFYRGLSYLILLCTTQVALAKDNKKSHNLWLNAEAVVGINKVYSVYSQVSLRSNIDDQFKHTKTLMPRLLVRRHINKNHLLSLGGALFTFENSKHKNLIEYRHTLQHDWRLNFNFLKSLRNRFEVIDIEKEDKMKVRMRHRLSFNLFKFSQSTKIAWSEELFYFLNAGQLQNQKWFDKLRSSLILETKFSKKAQLDIGLHYELQDKITYNQHNFLWLFNFEYGL